jgi:hypothetical protein
MLGIFRWVATGLLIFSPLFLISECSFQKSLKLPSQKCIPPVLEMAQKTVLTMGCDEDGNRNACVKGFHRKGLGIFATARNLAKVEHLKSLGIEILLYL